MKSILILCALILAGMIAWVFIAHPYRHHYGRPFRGLGPVDVAHLLERPSDYLKKDVRIEGLVTRQCPCCGCWFFVKDKSGQELRVEMGETAEALPFSTGKRATVEGELIHYGEGYEFVGTGLEFH